MEWNDDSIGKKTLRCTLVHLSPGDPSKKTGLRAISVRPVAYRTTVRCCVATTSPGTKPTGVRAVAAISVLATNRGRLTDTIGS